MRPSSSQQAARQARNLLVRTLPGSRRGTVRAHLARAERIGAAIFRRFQVGPYQAQAKHFRWYLETQTRDFTPSTRYRHWLTVRVIVSVLGKADSWEAYLQGGWIRPNDKASALKSGKRVKLPCI